MGYYQSTTYVNELAERGWGTSIVQRQRSTRVHVSKAAILIDSDGGALPVEVQNISSSGFRLRAPEALVVGERVQLRVSRYGDFAARILWVEGHDAGGEFVESVTLRSGEVEMDKDSERRKTDRRNGDRRTQDVGPRPGSPEQRQNERRDGDRRGS